MLKDLVLYLVIKKNINYLLVEKKETLFMRVFKRFKKKIESNGYKS